MSALCQKQTFGTAKKLPRYFVGIGSLLQLEELTAEVDARRLRRKGS